MTKAYATYESEVVRPVGRVGLSVWDGVENDRR